MIYKSYFYVKTNLYNVFSLADDDYSQWAEDFESLFYDNTDDFEKTYKLADYIIKITLNYYNVKHNEDMFFSIIVDTNDSNDSIMSDKEFFDFCKNFQETSGQDFFHRAYEIIMEYLEEYNKQLDEWNIKIPSSRELVYKNHQYYIGYSNINLTNLETTMNNIIPITLKILPDSVKEDNLFV